MPVRIITDSASDIVGAHDPRLTVLPLSIAFGLTAYRDGIDLSHRHFYELLAKGGELPTTSQVTPYAFEEAMRCARAAGEDIVVITLSSKLSGTYANAARAAARVGDVHLVDSGSVAIGERILVEYALRLADKGCCAADIATALESACGNLRLFVLLDTLKYAWRGGRLPMAAAMVGEMLAIKPVLAFEAGKAVIVGKAHGERRGRELLARCVERASQIDFFKPLALGYSGLDDAPLRAFIAEHRHLWEGHFSEGEPPIYSVGATIGTHAGPGAIGIAFFSRPN